jgi:hypothetical protein
MPEPTIRPLSASLEFGGKVRSTVKLRIQAQLRFYNTHIFTVGSFLRIMRGPDQLIRFAPIATLTKLAPDTFESELPGNQSRLIKTRNQTALISYDLAHNVRTVSKSYYDD